jgi:uncharacterized protein YbaR (Trm112 family)
MDAGLLKILRCPETHQALRPAAPELLEKLNAQIAVGSVRNRVGHSVRDKIDDGLVREDARYIYPVRQNLPVMLVDEAIPLN